MYAKASVQIVQEHYEPLNLFYISLLMRTLRQEPNRQDLQQLLKKLLHQNGMCLLIYPEGSNTSLLTALAETIHASEENLHQKLVQKLQHDRTHFSLPRRLSYVYDDASIVQDFRKHPQLVQFSKLVLQLFSASTERRLNLFSLVCGADCQYNLSCLIINEKGYTESINIARICNKYYNIKQRDLDSRHDLSLEDVFKNSQQIDSDQLIETFKSEKVIAEKEEKLEKGKVEEVKSTAKLVDQIEEIELGLKRAKSSMPYRQPEQVSVKENDGVSLGDKLQLREDAKLINQCSNGLQNSFQSNNYHQNNHMGALSPEQMYYIYLQSQYYTNGKSEGYLNYPQHMPIHSLSPTKSQIYKSNPPVQQPITNYYAPQNYTPPAQPPAETGETKRYTGRLKFFDDARNYGFIIMDSDESDIFVHYDDLQKAGISKDVIKSFKNEMYMQIRFSFKVMEYFGKYKKSRKAVELIIIDDGLSLISSYPLPE